METTATQTGQITGQLSTLADIFATVALYASTDPNKQMLYLAKITITQSKPAMPLQLSVTNWTRKPTAQRRTRSHCQPARSAKH